jgi:hypothetical protein
VLKKNVLILPYSCTLSFITLLLMSSILASTFLTKFIQPVFAQNTNKITANTTNRMTMHVILDIFSGRPNPIWQLSTEQESELFKIISQLETSKRSGNSNKESSLGLGYRGIIVEGLSKRFEIYNGTVKVFENNSSHMLEDRKYLLEQWLLQTGTAKINDNLTKVVNDEIQNRLRK